MSEGLKILTKEAVSLCQYLKKNSMIRPSTVIYKKISITD